jgi:diguanylate cyclase (GGDEF)-like protein
METPIGQPETQQEAGSLLGAMRVGGMILALASLSVVASYLAIQKGWIEPEEQRGETVALLGKGLDEFRVAILGERVARNVGGDGASARAAADRAWAAAAGAFASAAGAGITGPAISSPAWSDLAQRTQRWRASLDAKDPESESLRFAELWSSLESANDANQRHATIARADLARLIKIRTWIVLLVSGVGGVATWCATVFAMRRTRHALRRIAGHVAAIERGELLPRPVEHYVEIADVNRKLNTLGERLAELRDEARIEGARAAERQSELEAAHELMLELSRARTEHEVVEIFARRAAEILRASCVEVLRYVDPPGILEDASAAEQPNAQFEAGSGMQRKEKAPRIVEDPMLCLGFRSMATEPAPRLATICPASPRPDLATLCVPMQTSHGRIGVVHVCARPGEHHNSIRRELAEMLVRLFAPAMENARLLRESMERSATDPLTGLANRRRLEEFGTKAMALAVRQSAPLSVVLLDLDRFKAINDDFGHDAGDRALVAVARAMQTTIRETDLAARLGGDEFALLLPGSAAADAVAVVERLRETLAEPVEAFPFRLLVSAGIAEISPRATTLGGLLALADRALYDAKKGRQESSKTSSLEL